MHLLFNKHSNIAISNQLSKAVSVPLNKTVSLNKNSLAKIISPELPAPVTIYRPKNLFKHNYSINPDYKILLQSARFKVDFLNRDTVSAGLSTDVIDDVGSIKGLPFIESCCILVTNVGTEFGNSFENACSMLASECACDVTESTSC